VVEDFYAVIMAGGGGTRLWPLSRTSRPKQMHRLFGDDSLFQMAVNRLDQLFPPERILVVTIQEQASQLHEQHPGIPIENFLIEPEPRGTAAVVGLATIALKNRQENAVMAVLTADHFIGNVTAFHTALKAAYFAARDGHLITIGIQPTYPATGYGYIQSGELIGTYESRSVFNVLRFTEKPDLGKAEEMISTGSHYWNSGMFIWGVDAIMKEFAQQMPDLHDGLLRIEENWATSGREDSIYKEWSQLVPETIDYGVMEGANQVAVIPVRDLEWSDVGSWDSLFDVVQPTDEFGNIILGNDSILIDTMDTLVYSEPEKRTIAVIGVRDLILVDTGDVILVCHKNHAQKVKTVVRQLKDAGKKDLI
jgi:mannose-1-phosphate guanylyltransferase